MATSGSYDFVVTRDDILKDALGKVAVIDYTEANNIPDSEIQLAARTLNILTKSLVNRGLHIWRREEATLFMVADQQRYALGPTGDHCTGEINAVRASTTGITTMRVAGVTSDTTLEVTSTTGMAASDYIGVILDDGTLDWSTISSVTDSDTVVIAAGLNSAAAIGNKVYHYTSKIQRPLRMLSVMRRDANGNDTPLYPLSEDEYQELSLKTSSGKVNQYYYDPRRDTLGYLHLWVTADSAEDTVYFSYHRPVEDFDAANDNPDFPSEWYRYLVYALAYDIAPHYGIPPQERAMLKMDRDEALADAEAWDVEDASVYIKVRTQ